MTADSHQLNALSRHLSAKGIAAFCPTTLSADPRTLLSAVTRLGAWIRSKSAPGAVPLGIHLEGPFLHPMACGAHPPASLRALGMPELDRLWEASQHTLKIITLAPERLKAALMTTLVRWARQRKVILSI